MGIVSLFQDVVFYEWQVNNTFTTINLKRWIKTMNMEVVKYWGN